MFFEPPLVPFPHRNISQRFFALLCSLFFSLKDIIILIARTKLLVFFPVSMILLQARKIGLSFNLEAWFPMGRTISYAVLNSTAHYHLVSELHP